MKFNGSLPFAFLLVRRFRWSRLQQVHLGALIFIVVLTSFDFVHDVPCRCTLQIQHSPTILRFCYGDLGSCVRDVDKKNCAEAEVGHCASHSPKYQFHFFKTCCPLRFQLQCVFFLTSYQVQKPTALTMENHWFNTVEDNTIIRNLM